MIRLEKITQSVLLKGEKVDGTGMITPLDTCETMLSTLSDEIWNKDTVFLDMYCKSGNILLAIREKLFNHPRMKEQIKDDKERMDWILSNQLYGIAINKTAELVSLRNIYGKLEIKNNKNIVYVGDIVKLIKDRSTKELYEILKEKVKSDMKFDVVIGNPPYNNDLYLDFVIKAKSLIDRTEQADRVDIENREICMITPAKWQAKTDSKHNKNKDIVLDKNEYFRENIVPYMKKIIFYPCTEELFNIREASGISIYTISNIKQFEKDIKIQCDKNKNIGSDFEKHTESRVALCNNKIYSIVDKVQSHSSTSLKLSDILNFKRQIYVGEQERGEKVKHTDYVDVVQGEKIVGYKSIKNLFTRDNIERYKITTSIMAGNVYLDDNGKTLGIVPCNILEPYQVPKGSYPVLRYFDTLEECESFKSYYESKLVSFLFYFGACGSTLTKEFYRYIPEQPLYNHIFTDKELYKKYGLTEEEIVLIESIIKERKNK